MGKTAKHLFGKIVSFENLLLASKKARKNKSGRQDIKLFQINLEKELLQLQKELKSGNYQPAPYRSFVIYEPKERLISAAIYRDRVVHHAICNVVEPLLDKVLVYDTYANRKGKGVHAAIKRAQYYLQNYAYYLKSDIQKYFPSIDHELLKQEIKNKIACKETLHLIFKIIDNSNLQETVNNIFFGDDLFTCTERRKGLPIGNLTSQIFANYYLNKLDHFVKEELGIPGYVRYMDDFVLFHSHKKVLESTLLKISENLGQHRLLMHPNKTFIRPAIKELVFCGQQIFRSKRKLRSENIKKFKTRILSKSKHWEQKKLSTEKFECSINGWLGHAKQADTESLQKSIFTMLKSKGLPLVVYPCGSWRLLE